MGTMVETDDEHKKSLHVFVSSLAKIYKAVCNDQESTEMLESFVEYAEAFEVLGSTGNILPSWEKLLKSLKSFNESGSEFGFLTTTTTVSEYINVRTDQLHRRQLCHSQRKPFEEVSAAVLELKNDKPYVMVNSRYALTDHFWATLT